jgi:hypothetical protein
VARLQPGVMFADDDGRIAVVMSVDIADGLVQTIRSVINPDSSRTWDRWRMSARSSGGVAKRA